ncbi:TPA: hypothetical protein N0F65_011981 [Lagenidium giganteum]|uniref:Uncharacterized protein n=1 Tax=Lagenidium giganteum TaxID=4803 RepID=A0AAV2ZB46_9STRA|nr:TPA: hypothetical protein N0F65_011981 [Lagenidium giganteum]
MRLGREDVQMEAMELAFARDDEPRDAGRAEEEHARPEDLVGAAHESRACRSFRLGCVILNLDQVMWTTLRLEEWGPPYASKRSPRWEEMR